MLETYNLFQVQANYQVMILQMTLWRAATLLDIIKQYHSKNDIT